MASWNDAWMNRMLELIDNGYRPNLRELERIRCAVINAGSEVRRLMLICKSKGFDQFGKDAK